MPEPTREVLARFLAVSRRGVTARVCTKYGWREKAPMHPNEIATPEAALLAVVEERRRQIACGMAPTAEAIQRPVLPWTVIPLNEDGEKQ